MFPNWTCASYDRLVRKTSVKCIIKYSARFYVRVCQKKGGKKWKSSVFQILIKRLNF